MQENNVYQIIEELIDKREDTIKNADFNIERVSENDRKKIISTKEKLVSLLDDAIDQLKTAIDNDDEKLEEMIKVITEKANTATNLANKKFSDFKDVNIYGKDFDKFIKEESENHINFKIPSQHQENLDKVLEGVKKTILITKNETVKTGSKINDFFQKPEVKDYEKKTKSFLAGINKNVKGTFNDVSKKFTKTDSTIEQENIDNELKKNTDKILENLNDDVENIKNSVDSIKKD
jgi:hypothetical protein